jgi:hypothetical protein
MISFTPPPLYFQGKILWYPLDRRMGGTRADLNAMEEKIFFPAGNQNLPD